MRGNISFSRIKGLIIKDLRQKSQVSFLIFLAVFGLMMISYFNTGFSPLRDLISIFLGGSEIPLTSLSSNPQKFHLDWFPQSFYLLGLVYTSISFSEYSADESRIFHLLIPSTQLEKWLSKLIISAVLFPTSFIAFYMIFQWISLQWGGVQYRAILGLDDPYLWGFIMPYLSLQCFFILGSVYFKRYALLKTLALMAFSFIGMLVLRNFALAILLGEFGAINVMSFTTLNVQLEGENYSYTGTLEQFLSSSLWFPSFDVLICLLSIGALVLSFLKVKELEA